MASGQTAIDMDADYTAAWKELGKVRQQIGDTEGAKHNRDDLQPHTVHPIHDGNLPESTRYPFLSGTQRTHIQGSASIRCSPRVGCLVVSISTLSNWACGRPPLLTRSVNREPVRPCRDLTEH